MNDPLVQRHMPLSTSNFGKEDYEKFIQTKMAMWQKHGYGPWGFEIENNLVGWGGLQPFYEDIEIALVLHPKYWGYGKGLCNQIIKYAFENLQLNSIIILFPSSRKWIRGIFKLGFVRDGDIGIDKKIFHRYRLANPKL